MAKKTWRHQAITHVTALLLLVSLWQLLVWVFFRDSEIFPSPYTVLKALFVDIPLDTLVDDCVASLSRVGVGLLAAMILGIGMGMLLGSLPRVGAYLTVFIELFRPVPPIAWIPLAILWFGIGEMSSYFIIFLAAFFPIFTNSFAGAQSINPIHTLVARSLKVRGIKFIRHILLPAALPQITTGVRVGLGIAWMAVIASEMVAAQSGLGYMIQLNRLLLLSDRVIAGMLVIGLIGYIMNRMALLVGEKLTPWTQLSN